MHRLRILRVRPVVSSSSWRRFQNQFSNVCSTVTRLLVAVVLILLASAIARSTAVGQNLLLQLPSSATEGDGIRTNAAQIGIGAVATSNVMVRLSSSESDSVVVPEV